MANVNTLREESKKRDEENQSQVNGAVAGKEAH